MRQSEHFTSTEAIEAASRLGARIRRARKAQKLSLEQLERKCRIHRTTLGRLERGDTRVSFAVLLAVLEVLNALADLELVLTQPEVAPHARTVPPPLLERDF